MGEANMGSLSEEVSKGGQGLIVTRTTNTFTPTQLRNIEQMFLEAEPSNPPEVYKNAAGFAPPVVTTTVSAGGRTYVNLDSKNWQGGTTTVVTPSSAAPLFADLQSHTMMEERKVNPGGGRKSATLKDEELCPEEEERRRVRRERNKLAAARCRKRRVDQTETLQIEENNWEEKKRMLQDEIHSLQEQKEQLQFILEAHKSVCKQSQARSMVSKSELSEPRVVVKAEPPTEMETVRHLTHAEAMDQVQVHSTTAATTSVLGKPQRPVSLSLTNLKSNSMRSIEGIPIDTPTNAISSLNFDALMDGRTGPTPTNVLTPININLSTSVSLNPPSVSTPSCGSQQRSSGSLYVMQELGSPSTGVPNYDLRGQTGIWVKPICDLSSKLNGATLAP